MDNKRPPSQKGTSASENRLPTQEHFSEAVEQLAVWEIPLKTPEQGFASPGFYRMLGYTPAVFTLTVDTLVEMIDVDQQEQFSTLMQQLIQTGAPFQACFTMISKAGKLSDFEWEGQLFEENEGGGKYVGGHIRAVLSESKQWNTNKRHLELLSAAEIVSQSGSFSANLKTHEVVCSAGALRVFGLNPDLAGTPVPLSTFQKKIYAKDLERVIQAYSLTKKDQYPTSAIEYRIQLAAGEIRWLRYRFLKHRGESELIGTLQDITDMKTSEEAIANSQALFRILTDRAPIGVCLLLSNRRILYANDSYLNIIGYEKEEVIGQTFSQFTHEDDREWNLESFNQFAKGEMEQVDFNKRYVHKNGETVWVRISCSYMMEESRGERIIIAMTENISAQHTLRSELNLQDMIRRQGEGMMQMASWAWNIRENVFHYSPQLLKIYDLDPQQINPHTIRKRLDQRVHPEDGFRVYTAVQNATITGEFERQEFRIELRTGGIRWLQMEIGMIEPGEWMFGVSRDITHQKRAQARQQLANSDASLRPEEFY